MGMALARLNTQGGSGSCINLGVGAAAAPGAQWPSPPALVFFRGRDHWHTPHAYGIVTPATSSLNPGNLAAGFAFPVRHGPTDLVLVGPAGAQRHRAVGESPDLDGMVWFRNFRWLPRREAQG